MITFEKLKEKTIELGYYATDELLYEAYNALIMFEENKKNVSQEIYAICLEGPPGAGKTEFAKIYTKLCEEFFGTSTVERVEYQCDPTTGKTELFEDINISAAVSQDPEKVNIPGKIIVAIQKVNKGEKVILFIDEYDKAREETDAFLLQFLQDGKINSIQHGDLEIKEELKSNLQVIICKNDLRSELSGPLTRRLRFIELEEMTPELFFTVANRCLIDEREDKVNSGLINLVCLMYQAAYEQKELFERLPSCSEMLIALEDADRLVKRTSIPQKILYKLLSKNMFKSKDDLDTFKTTALANRNSSTPELSRMISVLSESNDVVSEKTLNDLIGEYVFKNKLEEHIKVYDDKVKELEKLIKDFGTKFKLIEKRRNEFVDKEIQQIQLATGKLVQEELPDVEKCFEDEAKNVKRGSRIFDTSSNSWTNIAELYFDNLSYSFFINKLIEYSSKIDVTIYEDGILLSDDGKCKLIMVKEKTDSEGHNKYRFMASSTVVPSIYMRHISSMLSLMKQIYEIQPVITEKGVSTRVDKKKPYSIDALVYSDTDLTKFDKVEDGIYHIKVEDLLDNKIPFLGIKNGARELNCDNFDKAEEASRRILEGKGKVLTHE